MSCPYVGSPRLFLDSPGRAGVRGGPATRERWLKLARGSKIARVAGGA